MGIACDWLPSMILMVCFASRRFFHNTVNRGHDAGVMEYSFQYQYVVNHQTSGEIVDSSSARCPLHDQGCTVRTDLIGKGHIMRKERQPQGGESLAVADGVDEEITILVSLIFRRLVETTGMHSRLTRQLIVDNVLG